MIGELNHNSLASGSGKFVQIVERSPTVPEEEVLKQWAIRAKPQECYALNIKHFKLAAFSNECFSVPMLLYQVFIRYLKSKVF